MRPRLRGPISVVLALTLAALGAGGCSSGEGSLSGRYEFSQEGGRITVDFRGGNKVNVTIGTTDGKDELTHHCVYTRSGDKLFITTDEPMGAPMTLLVRGDTLQDEGGTVFRKK